jgi:hypothetical protein
MFKKTPRLLIFLLLPLLLTACGPTTPAKKALKVDVEDLLGQMAENVKWEDMMSMNSKHLKNLYGIEEADVTSFAGAMKTDGITADEVLILEAKDTETAEALVKKLQARLKAKSNEAKDYLPAQYRVIEEAEIVQKERYAILLVSPDVEELLEFWVEAVKTK